MDHLDTISTAEEIATARIVETLFMHLYTDELDEFYTVFEQHCDNLPKILDYVIFDTYANRHHSILTVAIQENQLGVVRYLYEHGASFDFNSFPLGQLSSYAHSLRFCVLPDVLRYIVDVVEVNVNVHVYEGTELDDEPLPTPTIVRPPEPGSNETSGYSNAILQLHHFSEFFDSKVAAKMQYLLNEANIDCYRVADHFVSFYNAPRYNELLIYSPVIVNDVVLIENLLGFNIFRVVGNEDDLEEDLDVEQARRLQFKRQTQMLSRPEQQYRFRHYCYYLFDKDTGRIDIHKDLTDQEREYVTSNILSRAWRMAESGDDECWEFVKYLIEVIGFDPSVPFTTLDGTMTTLVECQQSFERLQYLIVERQCCTVDQRLMEHFFVDKPDYFSQQELLPILRMFQSQSNMDMRSFRTGDGESLLHLLMENYCLSKGVLHSLIVELGLDGKVVNGRGETLLMKLRRWKNERYYKEGSFHTMNKMAQLEGLLNYLVNEVGIDVNAQDVDGMTALMHCASCQVVDESSGEHGSGDDASTEMEVEVDIQQEDIETVDNEALTGVVDVSRHVNESTIVGDPQLRIESCLSTEPSPWQVACVKALLQFGTDVSVQNVRGECVADFFPWVGNIINENHKNNKRSFED